MSGRGKPSGRSRGTRGHGRGRGRGRGGNRSEGQHVRETAPTRIEETEAQREARSSYNSWKRLFARPFDNPSTMRQLWKGALSILEAGDRDWCQRLPQDLNDEDGIGHRHILALLNAHISVTDYETFISNARNFLLTITHPSILRCLAVDNHVGLIYNLFGGVSGKRAISFLRRLIRAILAATVAETTGNLTEDVKATLLAMSVALFELLRRESRVRFNDEIPSLVESIQTATGVSKDDASSDSLARIFNKLNDTRALLARAQGLLADMSMDEENAADVYNASSYPRNLIVPSDRFDNDKKDIADIILFPTRDEIMSDAEEFLPYTDPDQPHFLNDPVQRHIDTFFRLLRHDIFGELKEALAGVMHTVAQEPTALWNTKLSLGDMRAYHYINAQISHVTLEARKGLQVQVEFVQPAAVRRKSSEERERWWEESRRFNQGTLLSFIWIDNSATHHVFLTVSGKNTDPTKEYGLSHGKELAYITSSLATQDRATVRSLMEAHSGAARGLLLEFPNVIPATFSPILENLKEMHRLNCLPFQQWIVPRRHEGPPGQRVMHQIPPPLYTRTSGFKFSLAPLLKDENKDDQLLMDPTSSCDDEVLLKKLGTATHLDPGQCQALIAALTREYAFIQGPPGTGKSYLGLRIVKVLLGLSKKANLGPIMIVCYTNHALDQFLEHLLGMGVTKLIRVGAMSKSKRLEGHNLRSVSNLGTKTNSEKYMAAVNYNELQKTQREAISIFASLNSLRRNPDWKTLENCISEEHPNIHSQFRRIDDQGFKLSGRHPFDVWASDIQASGTRKSASLLKQIVQKANTDVYSLTSRERSALVAHWIEGARNNKIDELYEMINDATKTQQKLTNVHEELDRRVLEQAQVIGVTTTGLAKRIAVLQQVKCKVLICEEAGEIMESHMISALLPDVEHVIQIGDHEQLRPSVSNFRDLSLESERGKLHQLDRSQFERLCVGELGRPLMPVAQLNVQRRMRPQISSLIRETIYGKLQDHPSTNDLPNVVGMRHNVFWLDHTNFENQNDENAHINSSKSNSWEVGMVHALVRHIVRHGVYKSKDIAVLTPYTGQLQKLRATLRSDFEICLSDRDREALENDGFTVDDVTSQVPAASELRSYQGKPLEKKQLSEMLRIATVDNFQGEEAKIVIVSLVRSNEVQKVGFLKTTNRINVLLSRAKHGMYLIGNTETYVSVEMWQKVIHILKASACIGKSLALSCSRHPGTTIEVQEPDDFQKYSPEGGCILVGNAWYFWTTCRFRVAISSILSTVTAPRTSLALLAIRFVVGSMEPAVTTANVRATMELIVACVKAHVKSAASTPSVQRSVMSLARHALSLANGSAIIKASAKCHVQHHAIAYHAMNVAQSFCHAKCGMKSEEQPDMMMMSSYADIDLNESPIVVLGCGHFFTTETLDGHISLKDLYEVDKKTVRFIGLIENSEFSAAIPQCPNCREPVKQFVTQRYNRLINRAVIDESSKRFIVSGQQALHLLEDRLAIERANLETSRTAIVPQSPGLGTNQAIIEKKMKHIHDCVRNRYSSTAILVEDVRSFRHKMDIQHKPTYKLYQAIIHSYKRNASLDKDFAQLSLSSSSKYLERDRDQRVTLGGRLLEIKVQCLLLEDKFEIARVVLKNVGGTVPLKFSGGSPAKKTNSFLEACEKLIGDCMSGYLPKLAVETSLYYACIAHLFSRSGMAKDTDRTRATNYRNTAKHHLEQAEKLCQNSFRGRDILRKAVLSSAEMLKRDFYEEVSKDEIEAIKQAMVSGPGGIATHSGHWYNCANGHPFVIGECGMPMERARCPECGEPVGGQNHAAVRGVSCAMEME
ncbi:NFX1-type zinc finger-containing protein 1 [Bipolaris maydis]|nr:NFX1-type zinc finger-containing protein 1 [Bipolaris maydis]KAJ6202510.1 NFX1-type zinc finger-containing protein 1 [Bipolaris maydis]KAJ6208907.1 NFX1-type zinc finger-containing protein 1 [Bipolaris maydis]